MPEQRRRGSEESDSIGVERALAQLERFGDELRARHDVRERRHVLDPGDAAQGAHTTKDVHGSVAIVRPRGEKLETGGDVRGFRGEESATR